MSSKTLRLLSLVTAGSLFGCSSDDGAGNGGVNPTTGTSATTSPTAGEAGSGDDTGDSGGGDAPETATAGEDGGGDSTDDGGGAFINEPDGGGTSVQCDLWAQDCPDGEKCMPWADDGGNAWNATRCSPLDPSPASVGDVCTVEGSGVSGIDNCEIASMCWNVDPETGQGTCVGLCQGTADSPTCSDPATECVIFNDGTLPVCLNSCDPLLSDCLEREVCRTNPSNNTFVCSNDASGEMGRYGDPCEFGNACDPGLWCAPPTDVPGCTGSVGCCSEFCDINEPAACSGAADGQECIAWYTPGTEPPGLEHVGACGIPE